MKRELARNNLWNHLVQEISVGIMPLPEKDEQTPTGVQNRGPARTGRRLHSERKLAH